MRSEASFEWLSPDRLVQRTRFENKVELTANFGLKSFDGIGQGCVRAHWLNKRHDETFCPAGERDVSRG